MNKRETCLNCHKTSVACICEHIIKQDNITHLLILQHASESKHPLNTGLIAKLSFKNCELIQGDSFPDLEEKLKGKRPLLLFPGTKAVQLEKVESKNFDTIIVIDGTWRKAKKIYYGHPYLQKMPQAYLSPDFMSRYRIRKSPGPGKISTLEASVHALQFFDKQDYRSSFKAFDAMVDYQIQRMGKETFEKNYPNN